MVCCSLRGVFDGHVLDVCEETDICEEHSIVCVCFPYFVCICMCSVCSITSFSHISVDLYT